MTPTPRDLHYPNGVLRNKLGLQDPTELSRIERNLSSIRLGELARGDQVFAEPFDYTRLQAIHHHLFQDVYPWAGQPRTWDIAKPAPDGQLSHFIAGDEVKSTAEQVFAELEQDDYLDGYEKDTPIVLARAYSNLNVLHAFPDGNGRTNRLYIEQLAEHLEHPLEFDTDDQGEMLQATIAASRGDTRDLETLFQQAAARASPELEAAPAEEPSPQQPATVVDSRYAHVPTSELHQQQTTTLSAVEAAERANAARIGELERGSVVQQETDRQQRILDHAAVVRQYRADQHTLETIRPGWVSRATETRNLEASTAKSRRPRQADLDRLQALKAEQQTATCAGQSATARIREAEHRVGTPEDQQRTLDAADQVGRHGNQLLEHAHREQSNELQQRQQIGEDLSRQAHEARAGITQLDEELADRGEPAPEPSTDTTKRFLSALEPDSPSQSPEIITDIGHELER